MKWRHEPPDPEARCSCGTDEALARGETAYFRFAIVCPKHDGAVIGEREPGDPEPMVLTLPDPRPQ